MFTDDDLKRLKERMDIIPIKCGPEAGNAKVDFLHEAIHSMPALIARLEAAEDCIRACPSTSDSYFIKKWKAWRIAAGKTEDKC